MHKRIIAAVLLGTFVFVACVLNVAPNEGQSSEIEVKNEEIVTENKRGISSVIEDSLEGNNISGRTKHIEEAVKEAQETMGVEFVYDVDKEAFREATQPMIEAYEEQYPGVKTLMDTIEAAREGE